MKYLALMGSERKNRNTNTALDAFLEGALEGGHKVDKVYLKDLDLKNCIACEYCSKTGDCFIKDSMQEIYKKMDESDFVVVAAPIYFNSINALTKTLVDRSQRYWGIKYGYGRDKVDIPRKVAMFIGVGGADYTHDQFLGALPVMDLFFRATNCEFRGIYNISETDRGDLKDRQVILKELKALGRTFHESSKFFIQRA